MWCSTPRVRRRCSAPRTAARAGASTRCRAPARASTASPAGEGKIMAFENWRGSVGIIKPTLRPGSMEDLIRLLPDGIGVVITHINITTGTQKEFSSVIPHYEERVAELAKAELEVIHPAGAPPFFLLGYHGEQELI